MSSEASNKRPESISATESTNGALAALGRQLSQLAKRNSVSDSDEDEDDSAPVESCDTKSVEDLNSQLELAESILKGNLTDADGNPTAAGKKFQSDLESIRNNTALSKEDKASKVSDLVQSEFNRISSKRFVQESIPEEDES